MSVGAGRVERVHRALLDHALEAAAEVDGADVVLVTTGDLAEERAGAEKIVDPARLRVLRQPSGTFAEKLEYAAAQAFEHGYRHVVLIGADTPELRAGHLVDAFLALVGGGERRHRAVLGLSNDGGYYLLGLSAFTAAAFRAVEFGTARTAAQTLDALAADGFLVSRLEALADIDDARDVASAVVRLRAGGEPRLRAILLLLETLVSSRAAPSFFDEPVVLRPAPHAVDARGPPAA